MKICKNCSSCKRHEISTLHVESIFSNVFRCFANETSMQAVPVILERISGQTTVEVCTTVNVEVHRRVNKLFKPFTLLFLTAF